MVPITILDYISSSRIGFTGLPGSSWWASALAGKSVQSSSSSGSSAVNHHAAKKRRGRGRAGGVTG